MTKPTATPEPKRRQRSPEHQAATVAVELATLDEQDARAETAAAERKAKRAKLLAELPDDVRKLVDAMRAVRT